jgi:hypothetical protein
VVAHQERLVIEQVVVGRSAIHEQHDHPLGAGLEMGRPGRQRATQHALRDNTKELEIGGSFALVHPR